MQETVAQADRVTVGFEHDAVERVADDKHRKRNVPRQMHRVEDLDYDGLGRNYRDIYTVME